MRSWSIKRAVSMSWLKNSKRITKTESLYVLLRMYFVHPGVLVASWFKSKWRRFVFFYYRLRNKPKWKVLFNSKDPDEASGELILYFGSQKHYSTKSYK
jgi:hypothetical protein